MATGTRTASVRTAKGEDPVYVYLKAIGRTPLLTAEQEVDLAKRIEAGLYAETKLLEAADLDAEYRADLELVAEDGVRAKQQFIEANLRLVVSIAKNFTKPGVELLDVVQEGNLGLIRGIEKFDYTKGYKFSTYGTWWIRQAIQRGLVDIARTVRVPVHVLEALSKLNRLSRQWVQDHNGEQPTPADLELQMKMGAAKIEFLMEVNLRPVSFAEELGEDHLTIGDLIEDIDAIEVDELVSRVMLTELVASVLDTLTPREAKIMAMRHGIWDGNPYTLTDIGREIGLTRERIRQLEKQALAKLRHPERSQQLLDYAS